MITIIDYGMGNIGSILNMLKKIGVGDAMISSDVADVENADKLILPGVGAFDNGMKNLNELGLVTVLDNKVIENKTPILGICLGMQLFAKKSEEGKLHGLGWIETEVVKFRFEKDKNNLKVPHMGWNTIETKKQGCIFHKTYKDSRFYFVHPYYVVCKNKRDILAQTHYGYEFASAIQRENIIGVQFHPEKSHKFGMKVLTNFANCC